MVFLAVLVTLNILAVVALREPASAVTHDPISWESENSRLSKPHFTTPNLPSSDHPLPDQPSPQRPSLDQPSPDQSSSDHSSSYQEFSDLLSFHPSSPEPSTPKVLNSSCPQPASTLHLPDPPYDNYFYSDCHSSSHVIISSPLSGSNLGIVKTRLIVAWPAGNSGALALFAPEHGKEGSLSIALDKLSTRQVLEPINDLGRVGVSGAITFNDTARLTVPILAGIRTIREFTEGGSINQDFQKSLGFSLNQDGGATINRTGFDRKTTTWLTFTPMNGAQPVKLNQDDTSTLSFGAGTYQFDASFNYPQMDQLAPIEVLNQASSSLIAQNPDQTTSLSFLSYKDKLLAGTWRFLTYFGRDSMISLLLMQQILSDAAIEAVISAVLERLNKDDGTVCHEEVIGDFAAYINWRDGVEASAAPRCDYKMVDTDFFLPIAMKNYFVDSTSGQQRTNPFFDTTASFLAANKGLKYSDLAQISAEKIMKISAPFASSQTKENLIHLRDNEVVGEWRDSPAGLGGGRTPYDVNTALVPAGLRAIAALSRAGFFPDHPDWKDAADRYAQIWEDETLRFFQITVPKSKAISLISSYAKHLSIPSNTDSIDSDMTYYGLALDGNVGGPVVPVMNTDDCFRHFFVNSTNQTQLSAYISQTADHILKPFPVGLASDVGLFVSNPGYSGDDGFSDSFAADKYHGTVVWSWQLSMMCAGLSKQLGRCSSNDAPDFCKDSALHKKIISAYNRLWDIVDANRGQLSYEVWSWHYDNGFKVTQLGELTSGESNIRQLWSLTFLAIRREDFKSS